MKRSALGHEVARCEPLTLTARQLQVARYAVTGDARYRPKVKKNTYKTHVRMLLRRTGAKNLAQLALWVLRDAPGVGREVRDLLDPTIVRSKK